MARPSQIAAKRRIEDIGGCSTFTTDYDPRAQSF
jgi:hypothetical protein